MNIKTSIVFEKNWAALNAKNPDGTNKYRIIENVGSSRSTKTWTFFQMIYLFAISNRNKRVIVMRDTAIDCRDIVESEFKDWMNDPCARGKQLDDGLINEDQYQAFLNDEDLTQHVTENKTRHKYTFNKTNSSIIFTGADNLKKVIGKANDLVWVNEPYEFPEEVMLQLLKRVKLALLLDWNPNRDHYIEKFRERPDCIHIHSTFLDNPFLETEVKNELLGTKPLHNQFFDFEVEHYLKMSYDQVNADLDTKDLTDKIKKDVLRCYNNELHKTANKFHWEVYGLGLKSERPNRIFKWKSCPDSVFHSLEKEELICVDWGKVDPWGILSMKYDDGKLYLHELNYASENAIREKMTTTELEQIAGDEEGIVSWMFRRLNLKEGALVVCDTNRPMKIAMLRRMGFQAFGANKPKGSIIDGIDLLDNLEVYYTESSKNIAYEQENYSRKLDNKGIVLEEPEDMDNHLIDPTRYGALYLQSTGKIKLI